MIELVITNYVGTNMQVLDTELMGVKILVLDKREDARGVMEVTLASEELVKQGISFQPKEQRIYHMPQKGTFFGIHVQTNKHPQEKIIHLLTGRGIDYIVDLNEDSPTYKKWIAIELKGGDNQHIYIPQGYGHAFLSLEDNTTQLFTTSELFYRDESKAIRFEDPQIALRFPIEIEIISERDKNAPYLSEINFEV